MTFDRQQYLDQLNRKKAAKRLELRPQMLMVRQAAVQTEKLTGSPEWDLFLSFIEADLEQFEQWLEQLKAQIADSPDTDWELKKAYFQCEATIATLTAVMALPKDILARGEHAKSLLKITPSPPS